MASLEPPAIREVTDTECVELGRDEQELVQRRLIELGLGDIVRRAATLVPVVARLIQRCTTEADPGKALACECGAVASEYGALLEQVCQMPQAPVIDEVSRLLTYQLHLVTEASQLAFREHTPGWYRVAQRFGDGWGDPADRLISLAAAL